MRELLLFTDAFSVNRSRKPSGCAYSLVFFFSVFSYLNPSHRKSTGRRSQAETHVVNLSLCLGKLDRVPSCLLDKNERREIAKRDISDVFPVSALLSDNPTNKRLMNVYG